MYQNADYDIDSVAMIKTNAGKTIDCDVLSKQLNDQLTQQTSLQSDWQINCYQKDDWLIILINLEEIEETQTIVELITQTIRDSQILNNFIIANGEKIYFASEEDYPAEIINSLDSETESLTSGKKYSAANFSSGFIIFILSVVSMTTIGVLYYFSRPCVMVDKCELITSTNSSVSQTLKNKTQTDLSRSQIKDLQTELKTAIQKLNRIPRWSSYHQESTQLVKQYQQIFQESNYFLEADKLAKKSENMSKILPLSSDEWKRVKDFLQDAISQLNLISTPDFDSSKQTLIDNYNKKIGLIDQRIEAEEIGQEKLLTAEAIVQQINNNQSSIKSIAALEKREQQWQKAIKEIESIPNDTVSAKNKDDLLNSYLKEIINVQGKLTAEKEANKLLTIAQENIKLAQESEQENQWTKAVSFWQKALDSLKDISSDSLLQEEATTLTKNAQEQLTLAKESLNAAVTREKIKEELKTICSGTENICTYNLNKKKIEIFLTEDYFNKIKSLYRLNNVASNVTKKEKLLQHIEQVENNYQYLSNKYNLPVQVYNFNKKLIMIYNNN